MEHSTQVGVLNGVADLCHQLQPAPGVEAARDGMRQKGLAVHQFHDESTFLMINQPAPSFWLDNGMVWPISDFSVPWGAVKLWQPSLLDQCGPNDLCGPLNLMPANWYAGKPVTAMDMPIAYYPKALP